MSGSYSAIRMGFPGPPLAEINARKPRYPKDLCDYWAMRR
jgi:hypothetical protein